MGKAKVRDLKSECIKPTGIGLPEALGSNSQPSVSTGLKFRTRCELAGDKLPLLLSTPFWNAIVTPHLLTTQLWKHVTVLQTLRHRGVCLRNHHSPTSGLDAARDFTRMFIVEGVNERSCDY